MKIIDKTLEKIAINYKINSIFNFCLGIIFAPLYAFYRLHYFLYYWHVYLKTILKGKKLIIFSFSHPAEIRFVKKLIERLNKNNKIKIVIFSGNSKSSIKKIRQHINDYPIFPYGFLPLIKASLFFSTKSSLIWHKPSFTKKIHIFHSPSSMFIYFEGSLDSYDIFFAIGPHHKRELYEYMPKRSKKIFKVYEIGCEVIDQLRKKATVSTKDKIQKAIYAPTWGRRSSLPIYGNKVISQLLKMNLEVVFRPHSASLRAEKPLIEDILMNFKHHPKFFFNSKENKNVISHSIDLMVSDWSGVAIEFAIGCRKPVIFINAPNEVFNKNWDKYVGNKAKFEYRDKIGYLAKNPTKLPGIVDLLNKTPTLFIENINKYSKELVYNPGNSDYYSYKAVLEILNLKKNKINNVRLCLL